MKDAGAVTVDKRCRHTYKQLGSTIEFCHGVTLTTCVVVFMQLIAEESAHLASHLLFDVGAQCIAPMGASDGKMPIRVIHDRLDLFSDAFIFRSVQVRLCAPPVYPAIIADLYPLDLSCGVDRRPQHFSALRVRADMISLILSISLLCDISCSYPFRILEQKKTATAAIGNYGLLPLFFSCPSSSFQPDGGHTSPPYRLLPT